MVKTMAPVDVVVCGMGWSGSIMANQLAKAGHKVVGLERGHFRMTNPDFQPPHIHDEWRYLVNYGMFEDLSRETVTFRNTRNQTALPVRSWGAFPVGTGLGGCGSHWYGFAWRYQPWHFQIKTQTIQRYGQNKIPQGIDLVDWPMTYQELEPY